MNVIVDKWNRHARKPKREGPDTVLVDGEFRVLDPGNVRERKVNMPNPNVTISMNRHAIVDLALFGQEDRVEDLCRRLNGAVKRLKIPFAAGRRFRQPPKGIGAHPGLHNVQRWLDSVQRLKKNKDEMIFIGNLYATCRGRVRPEVLKELEG